MMKHLLSPRRTGFDYARHRLRSRRFPTGNFTRLALLVFFAVNGFLIGAPEYAQAMDKIRIGMGAFSPSNSAIWVAEERGFFKKHGLDVEAIFIGSGAARGINALLAGDIQFASASGGPVISSMLKGIDVMMIAALNNKGVHRLMVRPDIDTPAGEDNIVIGSDYGHNDTSAEIEALRTIKTKGDVDPRIIDKILYDNAKALYGI